MTDMPSRCEDFDTEPETWYHAHDLPRCKEAPVVGWGNPPRWICQRHFEERLRNAHRAVETAREIAEGRA